MKAPPSYAAAMQSHEVIPTSSDMNPTSYTQAMTIQDNTTEATNTRQQPGESSST